MKNIEGGLKKTLNTSCAIDVNTGTVKSEETGVKIIQFIFLTLREISQGTWRLAGVRKH